MLLSWSFSCFLVEKFYAVFRFAKKSLDCTRNTVKGTRLPVVPPCLYRKSIPLHLMITESPFRLRDTQGGLRFVPCRIFSRKHIPLWSIFRTYSSCQRVIFFTCKSVYHRNQICQDLFAVIFPSSFADRQSSRFLLFMVRRL